MLIARDYVGHMAAEVVKRLVEGNQIETKSPEAVIPRVRQRMMEELTVELVPDAVLGRAERRAGRWGG